jgi:hypothetical protein
MDSTNHAGVPSVFWDLDASGRWRHPAKQEEVPSAQFASIGKQDPVDGILDGVADTDASKLDGSAVRTVSRVHN